MNFSTSYADVAEAACRTGSKQFRKYGRAARYPSNRIPSAFHWTDPSCCFRITIDVFTCIVQIGFCCVYIVFIGDNLSQVRFRSPSDDDEMLNLVALTAVCVALHRSESGPADLHGHRSYSAHLPQLDP